MKNNITELVFILDRSYYAMSEAISSVRCNCAEAMNLEKYLNEDN